MLQEDFITNGNSFSAFLPGAWKSLRQRDTDLLVKRVLAAAVPKPVYHDFLPLGGFSESKAFIQILRKGYSQIICLKCMQRNIDLVKSGSGQEQLLVFFQKGSVCGEDHPKASLSGKLQKPAQKRMAKGLTHQMKV